MSDKQLCTEDDVMFEYDKLELIIANIQLNEQCSHRRQSIPEEKKEQI